MPSFADDRVWFCGKIAMEILGVSEPEQQAAKCESHWAAALRMSASSSNSVMSLPSTTTISDRLSETFCRNGELSRFFMNRVNA